MMQKKIAAGLAVLLAAGTILGGCGESGAAGNDSVSDAAGNPTSICLKPTSRSIWKNSIFSSRLIGSINA